MTTPEIVTTTIDTEPALKEMEKKETPKQGKKRSKLIFLLIALLLVLFLAGAGVFAYLVLTSSDDNDSNGDDNEDTANTCTYDGKTYQEGEGFEATDGCNSCSCSDGEVVCTLIACENLPEGDTGEETDPYADWKTFDNQFVTFKYPPTWKYIAENIAIVFVYSTDSDNTNDKTQTMVFYADYYNETGVYQCPIGNKSKLEVKTTGSTYQADTYATAIGFTGSTENEAGYCENLVQQTENAVYIGVKDVKEAQNDEACPSQSKCYPDLKFTYNPTKYPNGQSDFLLMMKTLRVK